MIECAICHIYKDVSCFSKLNKKKLSWCRDCYKKKCAEYNKKKLKRCWDKYGLGNATIVRFGLKTALFVYDRANRKCENCGNENNLTIHHKNNKGINLEYSGHKELVDNSLDNLIILCRRCHGSIHGKQNKGSLHRKGSGRKGGGKNGSFLRKGNELEYSREYYLKNKDYFHNYYLKRRDSKESA